MGSASRPLTQPEKNFVQSAIDTIYNTFKTRVANGRKRDVVYIDSIAQGRVWTGKRGIGVGIVDRTGTLQDAVDCAARMANIYNYSTKEYPEKKSWLEELTDQSFSVQANEKALIKEIGINQYNLLQQVKQLKEITGKPQSRLPFTIGFN